MGRRISARRLSMSRAAKKHLKDKQRQRRLGTGRPKQDRNTRAIPWRTLWILLVAGLIVLGLVIARL